MIKKITGAFGVVTVLVSTAISMEERMEERPDKIARTGPHSFTECLYGAVSNLLSARAPKIPEEEDSLDEEQKDALRMAQEEADEQEKAAQRAERVRVARIEREAAEQAERIRIAQEEAQRVVNEEYRLRREKFIEGYNRNTEATRLYDIAAGLYGGMEIVIGIENIEREENSTVAAYEAEIAERREVLRIYREGAAMLVNGVNDEARMAQFIERQERLVRNSTNIIAQTRRKSFRMKGNHYCRQARELTVAANALNQHVRVVLGGDDILQARLAAEAAYRNAARVARLAYSAYLDAANVLVNGINDMATYERPINTNRQAEQDCLRVANHLRDLMRQEANRIAAEEQQARQLMQERQRHEAQMMAAQQRALALQRQREDAQEALAPYEFGANIMRIGTAALVFGTAVYNILPGDENNNINNERR